MRTVVFPAIINAKEVSIGMKHNHITYIPCCYRWSTAHKINNVLVMTQTCIVLSCQNSEKVLEITFLNDNKASQLWLDILALA